MRVFHVTRRLLMLVLSGALLSSALAQAQERAESSWDGLSQLQVGQTIQVVQMNKSSLQGNFLGFTAEVISLKVEGGERTIQRAEVLRVSALDKDRSTGKKALWGLIGAGAGFAGGFFVGMSAYDDAVHAERKIMTIALATTAAGTAAGILAGGSTGYRTIYRKPQPPHRGLGERLGT